MNAPAISFISAASGGSQTVTVLVSDGAGDYEPEASSTLTKAAAQASTLPKEFRGPDDPAGIAGWTLADYDVWVETSA